jgi:hypothetical protein
MRDIRRELRTRMRDILGNLKMLQFIEKAGGTVALHARGGSTFAVEQNIIHVQKAGVFLHLYNLIESTVMMGLDYISDQIKQHRLVFQELEDCWQVAWATHVAKLDEDLATPNRTNSVLRICRAIADGATVDVKPKIGTGNLDDRRIEELAKRYGIPLRIRNEVLTTVKRQVFNDLGFLGVVRERRNGLAHGSESFADIGMAYSTADLTKWSWATYQYLKELLGCFERYVTSKKFRRV